MADSIYALHEVSHRYLGRFPALDSLSLEIREGERLALAGANGSGKSTLLLVLAGLIFPDRGSVRFCGREVREESFTDPSFQRFFRSSVGIVFQNSDVQLFNASVRDELLFGLRQLDIPRDAVRERIRRYGSAMGIDHLMERHPQHLSIGEKKRVALASTLILEPRVILLDEPTAGLDPRTTRHLIDVINECAGRGATIITATQDIHLLPEFADRIVVLSEEKRVARDGPAAGLLGDRAFLEAHNLVHVHAHKHGASVHVHPHEHRDHHHPGEHRHEGTA